MLEQLARDAGLLPDSQPAPPAKNARPVRAEPELAKPVAAPVITPITPSTPIQQSASPAEDRRAVDFSLTNEDLEARRDPGDPEAGCPSSRCTPREAIAWHELEPWDAWESFLTKISAENDLLWAVLQDLGLVGIQPGSIQLASPATGFAQTQLRENPEFKTAFEHFTAEYFGEVMRLEILDASPGLPHTPSLALVDAERHRRHREAICSDAERNPRIRSLLSAFAGELLAVEPLESPPLPPVGQRGVPRP